MRKATLSAVFMLSAGVIFAQGAKVLNAYNYMQDNEFLKAKAEIEPATEHAKTKEDAKTWYYRGQIYDNIYRMSITTKEGTDELLYPQYTSHKEGAVKAAVESYEKALSIESKKINKNEVKAKYANMFGLCAQEGIEQYNVKAYEEAGFFFAKSYDIGSEYMANNPNIEINDYAYNAGLAYRYGGNAELAEKYFNICIGNGVKVEESYVELLKMYQEAEQNDQYQSTLMKAREALPNSAELVRMEIDIYLQAKDFDKALASLNEAINLDPSSSMLYFVRGNIQDHKHRELAEAEKKEEAVAAFDASKSDYAKAIELDPTSFDATYSMGALLFNRGAEMLTATNDIADDNEYKIAKTAAEDQLKEALPYLEKAYELDPDDRSTIASLKELYARTNQMDKYNEMKEKLEN